MTTINNARAAILNRLVNSGLLPITSIDFGGGSIETEGLPTDSVWVRPVVKFAGGGVDSLGGEDVATRRVRSGTCIIQVFAEVGLGEFAADEMADSILRLYEGRADRPIYYRSCYLQDIGRDDAHWQKNVVIGFDFDVVCA